MSPVVVAVRAVRAGCVAPDCASQVCGGPAEQVYASQICIGQVYVDQVCGAVHDCSGQVGVRIQANRTLHPTQCGMPGVNALMVQAILYAFMGFALLASRMKDQVPKA